MDFWTQSKGYLISEHIAGDALWRSTPTILRYWVHQRYLKKKMVLSDTSSSDEVNNPFLRHPRPNFVRVGENQVISRAGAVNPGDIAASSSDVESRSDTFVYQSAPEQYSEPTARERLGQMLRMRPYQSDPNDAACSERIVLLEDTVRQEDENDADRLLVTSQSDNLPSGSAVSMGETN